MRLDNFARRTGAAVLGIALLGGANIAQAQDLPPAADLVAKYQAAIGGKDALAGRKSMHSTGEFSIPAAGMSGQFEAYSARPNLYAMRVTVPGFGDIRSGYTGEVGWSLNPMEGPRLLTGAEATQTADDADFDSSLRLEGRIASMTTVELTKLGGRDCYKVRVEWKSGRETFDCYSPETGLLVGSISKQESNMGSLEAITLYDDYRSFDGFSVPTRMTVQVMGMEQVISITSVMFDHVEESAFAVPTEVKPLIGG
jgi:hypothetical protein